MIPFNKPPRTGNEDRYLLEAANSLKMAGGGDFSERCQHWFESYLGCSKALLTPSCTHALEMAAILAEIRPGDEVIMPSYTFVSTANAFVLRGAVIVFVDIRADTMNIDERLIEDAITSRTRVIVPVHYAGVACEMDSIMDLAEKYGLIVVEDAAQGLMSTYKGRPLGSIGHLAAFSFHETKNLTSGGEGGLLAINDPSLTARAEVVREKGTNRSQFFRGMVDKYTWVDIGSSYLPGELQAAYLWGQLEVAKKICGDRLATWERYRFALIPLAERGLLELGSLPAGCEGNGHMFYFHVKDIEERDEVLAHLRKEGVLAVFHYVPLHTSPAGLRYSRFHGVDEITSKYSQRLVRLPLWYGMREFEVDAVITALSQFFIKGNSRSD